MKEPEEGSIATMALRTLTLVKFSFRTLKASIERQHDLDLAQTFPSQLSIKKDDTPKPPAKKEKDDGRSFQAFGQALNNAANVITNFGNPAVGKKAQQENDENMKKNVLLPVRYL